MSTMNVQKPQKPLGGFARGMGRFRGFREGTTILIILVLGVIMSLLSPVFLTGENFSTMFKIFAINGLVVIGMNSIAAYMIAHLFEDFIRGSLRTHLGAGTFAAFGSAYEPFVMGSAILFCYWLILLWMYRRRLFLRI